MEKVALSTWIFTIALNQLRSHYHILKGKGTINLEDMENLHTDTSVESEIEANESKATLIRMYHIKPRSKKNKKHTGRV